MALSTVALPLTRPASTADRDAVVELIAAMGGHDEIVEASATPSLFGSVLEDPDGRSLVAVLGGRVVGYAEIHARPNILHGVREAWLAALVVGESHRNAGIGEALLNAVDREAARLGCEVVVLESSDWRTDSHRFYERAGFTDRGSAARRFARPVHEPLHTGLVTRFLDAASRAASAAAGAVAGLRGAGELGSGADGRPTLVADRAAEDAVLGHLAPLGLAVISEESGNLVRSWSADEPWVCLDPLDGSRNYGLGHPPWATAIGLVVSGQPIAGLVHDHTTGTRWWASSGSGAWVDGRPARPRPGGLLAVPSVGRLEAARLRMPAGYQRVRMSGSTAIDLCRVADGSLGAFLDIDRGVVHPHDLAAPLAILTEAGAVVSRVDRAPIVIEPDPSLSMKLAVAADRASLEALLADR
ncbi:MAG: inositol monophosphatase family protein [Acidimicrobiales bacterium]